MLYWIKIIKITQNHRDHPTPLWIMFPLILTSPYQRRYEIRKKKNVDFNHFFWNTTYIDHSIPSDIHNESLSMSHRSSSWWWIWYWVICILDHVKVRSMFYFRGWGDLFILAKMKLFIICGTRRNLVQFRLNLKFEFCQK